MRVNCSSSVPTGRVSIRMVTSEHICSTTASNSLSLLPKLE